MVSLQPGYTHIAEKHLGEEYILIQNGELTLEIQGETCLLSTNDTIKFNADTEHTYTNTSEEAVQFYIVIYYPDQDL